MLYHTVAAAVLCGLAFWLKASLPSRMGGLFLFILCIAKLLMAYQAPSIQHAGEHESLILFQLNILYANANPSGVAEHILSLPEKDPQRPLSSQQPDVLVFQEATEEIREALLPLEKHYPYLFANTRNDAFGSLIYSKLPFASQQRLAFPDSWNSYSLLTLHTPRLAIPLTLIELHTLPPVSDSAYHIRNQELINISGVAQQHLSQATLLVGDLNITPYSRWYQELEKNAGLSNAMRGITFEGTWPAAIPLPLRIPIDHLLISDKIEVKERVTGPDLDSDHLPVTHVLNIYR